MLGHPIRGRTTSSISRNSLRMGDYRRPKLFLLMQPLTCIGSYVRWCNNTSFLLKLKDGGRGFRYGSCFSCYTNVRSERSGPAGAGLEVVVVVVVVVVVDPESAATLVPQWEPSSQVQIIEKVKICPPLESLSRPCGRVGGGKTLSIWKAFVSRVERTEKSKQLVPLWRGCGWNRIN